MDMKRIFDRAHISVHHHPETDGISDLPVEGRRGQICSAYSEAQNSAEKKPILPARAHASTLPEAIRQVSVMEV